MNKKLVALVAAAMMTVSAGSVFAAPVTLDGSVSFQARNQDNYNPAKDGTGNKLTFKLNAKTQLTNNMDFYARLAGQRLSRLGYAADFYDGSKKEMMELDQYGVIIKGGDFNFKLGRQGITVGANATLYSSGSYIGKNMLSDGLTVSGKTGVFDVKAVIAKEDTDGPYQNKIYALSGSYSPAKNWTLGATLAKYKEANQDTNFWAINAGYAFSDKASVSTEYAQSNYSSDNKAYNISFNYAFDNRLSGYIVNHKTEANADMGRNWTDFENNEKGFYYGLDYKAAKNTTISVFYKDNTVINDSSKKDKSLRGTVTYNF